MSAADACAACALCMGLRRRSPVTMSQTTIPTRWVRLCVRSARWQGVKQCAVHHAGLWARVRVRVRVSSRYKNRYTVKRLFVPMIVRGPAPKRTKALAFWG